MNKKYNLDEIIILIKKNQHLHPDVNLKLTKARNVIKHSISANMTISHALKQHRFPKQTFYDYLQSLVTDPLTLINQSRAPHKTRLKYNWPDIIDYVYKIQHPGKNRAYKLTVRTITQRVNRKFGIQLHPSTLQNKLKETSEKLSRVKASFGRWEIADLGYIQMDGVNPYKYIDNIPKSWHVFTAVDCYSRMSYFKCYDEQTKTNSIKFYKEAKEFFKRKGIQIFHVRTDNGFEWVNSSQNKKWRKVSTFEYYLHCDYVKHDTTESNTPHHNGKVEKFNQSLHNECIKHLGTLKNIDWTIELLNRKLKAYQNHFNNERYHSTLKKTPSEVLSNYLHDGVVNEHVFV